MKTLIISGASGYLGQNLINYIKDNNYDIDIIGLSSKKNEDFWALEEPFEDAVLLNLAFPRNQDINQINNAIDYTFDLYNRCALLNVSKIINMSTQSVYDINRKIPASEDDIVKPFSLYGLSKYFLENFTGEFCEKKDIDYINIRLSSIVGDGFEQRFINKFIRNFLDGKDLEITEKNEVFSYLYIKDAVKGILNIILSDNISWGEVYNLGSSVSYTISDIANSIYKNLSSYSKSNINIKNEVKGNEVLKTNQVSVEKLYENIGFKASTTLDDIVYNISESIINE